MASDNQLSSPLGDVFKLLIQDQVSQFLRTADEPLDYSPTDLADWLPTLLASGRTQKDVYREIARSAVVVGHSATVSEFCSWLFATFGVLSTQYGSLQVHETAMVGHGRAPAMAINGNDLTDPNVPAQNPAQNSDLLRLPNELFDAILRILHVQDINDLRLTCREGRLKTFASWSQSSFSTRQFMMDHYSLLTLVDISRHPQLSKALTHLIIGCDEINAHGILTRFFRHYLNDGLAPEVLHHWGVAASAQQALLNTGSAITLLSMAISNLPNLKNVSICGSREFRRLLSHTPTVQDPGFIRRSYGSAAYEVYPRDRGSTSPNLKGFDDRVFSAVLHSLLRCGTQVSSIETRSSEDKQLVHLGDEAFNLLPSLNLNARAVLGGLSKLHLGISLRSNLFSTHDLNHHFHGYSPFTIRLRKFLGFTRNLQWLALDFQLSPKSQSHCGLAEWLCEPTGPPHRSAGEDASQIGSNNSSLIHGNPVSITLPFLRRLDLNGLSLPPSSLRAIFTKFDGLTSSTLCEVCLTLCPVGSVPTLGGSDEIENPWASFFRDSSTLLAKLQVLRLKNLAVLGFRFTSDDVVTTNKEVIFFVPDEGVTKGPQSCPPRSITVTDFGKEALEKLAEKTWLEKTYNRHLERSDGDEEA
ncbi:hypothetical protein J7T55_001486 [Diaporthe amygdali]|uniref:uncharacterized protein n=1 Tax=Phomopsis amygdali TaxID=1214568 RepID=UPI0022FE0CF9|nr:uncharacterized protein J7T55_001486 [Diaporthe amygdali]KAJ0115077.1 hypothetical protein J7T55_001486 [Diaporthe amygdali]